MCVYHCEVCVYYCDLSICTVTGMEKFSIKSSSKHLLSQILWCICTFIYNLQRRNNWKNHGTIPQLFLHSYLKMQDILNIQIIARITLKHIPYLFSPSVIRDIIENSINGDICIDYYLAWRNNWLNWAVNRL